MIKTITFFFTILRVWQVLVRGHRHTTSTFAYNLNIPTNYRHVLICFMKGVSLQYWAQYRKSLNYFLFLLLKGSNRFAYAVRTLLFVWRWPPIDTCQILKSVRKMGVVVLIAPKSYFFLRFQARYTFTYCNKNLFCSCTVCALFLVYTQSCVRKRTSLSTFGISVL